MEIGFVEHDYIKQEDGTKVKEEESDILDIGKPSQRYPAENVIPTSSPNVIVLRRPVEESAAVDVVMSGPPPLTHFRKKSPVLMMPPPLAQLRRKSPVTKTFTKKISNTDKSNRTYERRKVVAHERTVDVMNRMANSLSTMASSIPLLLQELIKVKEELKAVQSTNKKI